MPRRLRVFAATGTKQLFEELSDPRIALYNPGPGVDAAPDLVVFPVSQPRVFQTLTRSLPESVRARVVSGKARILFEASQEGLPHDPERSRALHAFVEELGGQAWRAIYVTQNRIYREAYQAWCASLGVRPMTVLCYDYWIKRFFSPLEADGEAVFESRLEAFRRRPPARLRRFISLNWSPRPWKVFFLLSVLRDRLWDAGYISFGGLDQLANMGRGKDLAGLFKVLRLTPGFEDLYEELRPQVKRLAAKGQIQVGAFRTDPESPLPAIQDDQALVEFGQSWFSVITETEMTGQPERITEKPFKPLVNFHPVLMFGNPGALRMLRELGFETFPEVIDETYDEEPDPRRRFELAYREFARLCRMTDQELAELQASIADKLTHNARYGLTVLPSRYRLEIDRALVDDIARYWTEPGAARAVATTPRPQSTWPGLSVSG